MTITPVGAFKLDVGPETPTYYLLIPATSVEALVTLDMRLAEDTEFLKASTVVLGSAGLCARICARGDVRSCQPLRAGQNWLRRRAEKRIFQLRTYESAGYAAHVRKVQMFNEAEIGIFTRTGLAPVFFGDTLIGHRMPSLTYMLTFADVADLNAKWAVVWIGSSLEGTLAPARKCGCGDREQYLESVSEPVELFTDLKEPQISPLRRRILCQSSSCVVELHDRFSRATGHQIQGVQRSGEICGAALHPLNPKQQGSRRLGIRQSS